MILRFRLCVGMHMIFNDLFSMIYFIREINKVESQSAKFTAYLECKSAIRPILKGQK